jgi:enamine deaminase RidA (YjgF/YER057c/UK114 family)
MGDRERYADGGRFEEAAGYSRAIRAGSLIFVSGTTAVEPSGRVHAPGDVEAQTRYVLQRIQVALRALGADLQHVVRVRATLADIAEVGAFARAHRELLGHVRPALTGLQGVLTRPELVVEIEVDAVV